MLIADTWERKGGASLTIGVAGNLCWGPQHKFPATPMVRDWGADNRGAEGEEREDMERWCYVA